MRLRILGKSPSWPDAGGACAGYLLEHPEATVLIDCGSGVFSKLRRFYDYASLDAVVISHLHADHFLDLIPYAYALTYTPRHLHESPGTGQSRLRVLAPPGASQTLATVAGAWKSEEVIENAFSITEYEAPSTIGVGPFVFSIRRVPHFIESHAMAISQSGGQGKLCYSADSGPSDELVDLARGASVFLCEATLEQPERAERRGHLTPREAGEHGLRAGVERIVLTHLTDELDSLRARNEAAQAFGGPVEVAREGAVYEL